jgi:hypothetical protein
MPAEGWLFGQSPDSIPDDVADHCFVFGELTVTEESGSIARMKIRLQVDRSGKVNHQAKKRERERRSFQEPDPTPHS